MKRFYAAIIALLALAGACSSPSSVTSQTNSEPRLATQVGPWSPAALARVPAYRWLNGESESVRQLIYSGPAYGSLATTDVFAYYARPSNGATGNNPAIVLIHGGAGQAYRDWVEMWAARGYHTIAMDLGGVGADGQRLVRGGPEQNNTNVFPSIAQSQDQQWIYHAVANVLAAHALVRSLPGVDSTRTALAGISWGGFLACIVVGLDPRIDAAAVSYGSGYLQEPGGIFDPFFAQLSADQKRQWIAKYDPANYITASNAAMLWVSGATDLYFTPYSQRNTHRLVASRSQYSLRVSMNHSQGSGANPEEITLFMDRIFKGGSGLNQITDVILIGQSVKATIKGPTKIDKVTLAYTLDSTLPYSSRRWQTLAASLTNETITATLPVGATVWFINASDVQGTVISSPYQLK